jgi:SAM-dependent methyltransferase
MTDWFEKWFGEEYLTLYPHRDEEEAQLVATLIDARVQIAPNAPALDLACGAGRHSRALTEHWWTVGLDLSPALLRVARDEERDAPFVRADMRCLPFRSQSFGLVVNLFTSFGYFRDDAQHRHVIGEVARVTQRGGSFVLDYLNAPYVRATLVPFDRFHVGERVVEQEREISADGRFVRKTITLADEERTFIERVRLFEHGELIDMLDACGFDIADALGDYDGRPYAPESPRTILIGCRR